MTKRISPANTVAVPVAAKAAGGAVANPAVVPVEAEVAAVKVEVADKEAAPAVVAEAVAAMVAPAPIAMVAEPVAAAEPAAQASTTSTASSDDGDTDYTPYIVGGVLLAGGILAVALSSGDDKGSAPAPTPTPTPTNAVTISSAATASIAENSATTATVIDVNAAASNASSGAITYTLGGTDAAAFNIDASTGVVTFKTSPDFETKASYSITVTANAAASGSVPAASATQTITVTVTNVNEAPRITSATSATVAENAAITTPVYTAAATDPEGTAVTYTLGGTDAAAFTINSTTGAVSLRAPADFEAKPSYSFTVTASDGALSSTQTVTLNVTNVNEAPVFSTTTRTTTVAENVAAGTALFTAGGAVDPDAGATVTYSLTGTDAAAFAVNPTTGAVTFVASPNFEAKSSYSFNLVATDQAGLSTSQANTVTITNVNEAPVFAAATATATVAENTAVTTPVFTAAATDPEGAAVTYTLGGTDASAFTINAATGAVSLRAPADFETKPSYSFTVTASDGTLSSTQTVTLNVTNVNEAPSFASATRTAAIDENVAAGTVVLASSTATDPDAGAVLTYSLSGTDASRFTINSTTGAVSIVASPDFETKSVYNFNVVATDQGGLSATQAVTLNINDLPEGIRIDGGSIPASTAAAYSAANGNVTFLESGAVGNISNISNFTSGDIILTDVATNNYSFSSDGTTLRISYNNGGIVSQINLVGAVSADAIIVNEQTAEAAVGFDFFRSTAPAAPAASVALDTAGSASTTYNANATSATYTDSVAQANTSVITNFSGDDRIVMTGINGSSTATSASFTSDGSDLIISFNNNGIVSKITLAGVVNPNGPPIFDEASAERAIGFDFFRYG